MPSTKNAPPKDEASFRELAERCSVGIWHITPDGYTIYINPAMCRLIGIKSPDEIENLPIERFFSETAWAAVKREQEFRLRGQATNYEVELRPKGGPPRYCVISGVPVLSEDGKLRSLIGAFTDITEMRAAEQALREKEVEYERLLEALKDGLCYLTPDGEVKIVNETYCRLLKLPREKIVGRCFKEFLPESMFGIHEQKLQERKRGQSSSYELVIRASDGEEIPLLVSGGPTYAEDGQFSGSISISRDLREQKRLEQQLFQAQKMEAFGQLAGGIAHDFNNILTIIEGASDLLLHHAGSDYKVGRLAGEIKHAAERGSKLARQLLSFSRGQVLERSTFCLRRMIRGMETMLRRVIREDIELQVRSASEPCLVKADRAQLELVLLNLVLNASDAMGEGGVLTIETFCGQRPMGEGGVSREFAAFSVEDTGEGIPKELRERIFEPFFTTKPPGTGTGLGLAMVFGIVSRHDGSVEVESEPGSGSKFSVFLERAGEDEVEQTTSDIALPESAQYRPLRVLVVDDDPHIRSVLTEMLIELGHHAVSTYSVEGALHEAQTGEPPEVIITDIIMPGIRGPGLVERVREILPDIRAVYMSGHAAIPDMGHCLIEGSSNVFLQKPFSLAQLAAALSRAVRR